MTSSMLTGERRWATARRGGMTVLGKVAVPKPINLPSQRLENHGLDPNVEIVPKGTHSWGSKSSSSTTNAWGSSNASSPKNDGTGSPNYLSGRPSSGGSATRPSTADSERAQEPNSNAWGSNSRPSSASGALTSSQSSLTSLRPRSAETRPGSSQLSRFAEPLTDSSVAWGANRTAEKLGMASAKNDGFSLTTGDFPTLGSEKETSGKSTESQDHGPHSRPSSSSGGVARAKEMTGDDDGNSNIRNGTSNSWRRESHMYGEDGTRNYAEKWHQDPHPYPNSNIPPQQYDAWRGPPVNSHPGGVWYRGPPPPGGPPFGSPVGPGSFPMEPFPYYRPQIPPGALTNPQAVPPPGAGPRGARPKNGDMYRPHMPDAYMRPGMPIRPSFYPGPVPYDGYYGPPMGYCNSNERDIPFMGMPMGPTAYHPYSGANVPDPSNSRGRAYGPSSKGLVSEQMESSHPQDARGPYKVLLKQRDGWEGRDEQKWDETATVPYPGKGDHPKKSSWENGWRANHTEEEMDTRRMTIHAEGLSESSDNQGGDSLKVPEGVGQLKASDDGSVKDIEQGEPGPTVLSKVSPLPREPSLIQKIEGLNAKARASDGRQDVQSASSRGEQKNKFQASDEKNNTSVNEAAIVSVRLGNTDLNTVSYEGGISAGGKGVESMGFGGTTTSRRSTHGAHGGADRRGRGRINAQETDGWRKKPPAADPPSLVSPTVQVESSIVRGLDNTSAGAIEKPGSHCQVKNGESLPLMSDPSDSQSQRARITELTKQRLKQREKEEEEREREQRAKALAKLEELNRRTLAGEVSSQKQETVPNSAIGNKQEESSAHMQPTVVGSKSRGHNSVLGPSPSAVVQSSESSVKGVEISLSRNVSQTTPNTVHKEPHSEHGNSVPVHKEANNSISAHLENEPHAHDIGTSKQKCYRQKQQSSVEKNSVEKSSASAAEPSKGGADVTANATVSLENVAHDNVLNRESSLPVNHGVMSESSIHKRKNRSGKSKHKMEEASSNASLPSKDTSASDVFVESNKTKDAESVQDPSPVEATIDSKDANQSSDQVSVLPNEEVHVRVNNQWKSQHPRKPLRNPHSNRSAEKFQGTDAVVWAPVRSHKNEFSGDANQRPTGSVSPSVKNDQQVQNNPRSKRAEMERYVPKPAAKEMSQQGSSHQLVTSSINQMTSDETIGKSESSPLGSENSQTSSPVAGKAGSTVDYRHGDGRQNKSGKAHGAWRQRATAESSTATSNTNRNVQKPTEHHHHQKTDLSSVKDYSRHTDEWSASDGWNILEKSDVSVTVPVVKEQGVVVKGKRYKTTGYSHHVDEKRVNSEGNEKVSVQQSSAPEMNQSQLHATSKENRSVGDRSGSHWQPKANAPSVINEQGSRSNNGQNVIAEFNTANKKDSTFLGGVSLAPQLNKESAVSKAQHPQGSNVEELQGVGHQEPKRGRKLDVHDRRPVSPVDPSPSNIGARHEQRGSSGFRKNGSQNSRFGREHEYNGDWSGLAKDSKQHNAPAQREKQRQSAHYEYQPVGADNNRTGNTVPTNDGSRNSYGRYKERGQAHPRRGGGNSSGRQTGNVRADASYE